MRFQFSNTLISSVDILQNVILRLSTDALLALVEDPEGNVERLALYNWTSLPKNKEDQMACRSIDQSFLPTADEFRRHGNDYFASKNYTAAIDEYSNGIKLKPQNVTLFANRAEAYLQLFQFHNARNDAEVVLKYDPTELLKHAEILDSENENGQYDYISIIDECCERAKIRKDSKGNDEWVYEIGARLDHADFLCEDIEILSKAFSIVYSHEVLGYSMKINIQNDQTLSLCSVELIHRITQKLLEEPYHRQEVYKLYNSLNLDKTNMNLANVDIIGNIVGLNSFELNNIIVGNSSLSGEGLWILPSYFNHSCIDENGTQYILGDLMFIRSLRPILQGEELLVNYRSGESNNEIRLMLLKSMGIDCQCRLCKLDKSETPETTHKRAQLLNTVEKLLKLVTNEPEPEPSLIKKLEKTIFELHNLRKEHPELEFDTLEPNRIISLAYRKNGNLRKALSILKGVYNSYKNVYLKNINWIVLDIVSLCTDLKQMEEARKWVDILLKGSVEPLLGKFKDEDKWKKEALYLMEKKKLIRL
ncbi:hypothetical protein GLOIN_2v1781397 [Rhizophagus irregularis DAOM 181602=DAOM 197198]|nr:hypothetical protein GLOIN_2v1781397 [Rhizophagus irregularis DAOM 181602=DAOM 197198]